MWWWVLVILSLGGRTRRVPRGLLAQLCEFQANKKTCFSSKQDEWLLKNNNMGDPHKRMHAKLSVCAHVTCQNSITLPKLKEIFFSLSKHSGRAMGQYEDNCIQNKVTRNDDQVNDKSRT